MFFAILKKKEKYSAYLVCKNALWITLLAIGSQLELWLTKKDAAKFWSFVFDDLNPFLPNVQCGLYESKRNEILKSGGK